MASVQSALLDDNILAHDEPVCGHLAQFGQNTIDVLVGIDERDHYRQFASGFDEMRGVDPAASEKTRYGVEGDGSEDIFFAQVFQDLEVQRAMMPGIAFG
jgi:hypothetical protein